MSTAEIESLVANHDLFNELVYTPLEEAVREMYRRRADPVLSAKVQELLGDALPAEFLSEPRVVLARHLITPDHETVRFLAIPDSLGIKALFFEYLSDKFIFKNPGKYHLAKMSFYKGVGKKGGEKREDITLVDFDETHGKPIVSVKTVWGESLVDFHHNLLLSRFPHLKELLFDGSAWYAKHGGSPEKYYKKFLALFFNNGILFENFFLNHKELAFTRDIFLPAFIELYHETGLKPLIVALEPTQIEGDEFWLHHPYAHKEVVENHIRSHTTDI